MNYELREDQAELLAFTNPLPGVRMLDAGCGTGWLAGSAGELGAEAYGIDTNADLIEQARARWPKATFFTVDLRDFESAEPFDLVVCRGILEWMPAQDAANALFRLVRAGGRIVVETGAEERGSFEFLEEMATMLGGEIPARTPSEQYLDALRVRGFPMQKIVTADNRRTRFETVRD